MKKLQDFVRYRLKILVPNLTTPLEIQLKFISIVNALTCSAAQIFHCKFANYCSCFVYTDVLGSLDEDR